MQLEIMIVWLAYEIFFNFTFQFKSFIFWKIKSATPYILEIIISGIILPVNDFDGIISKFLFFMWLILMSAKTNARIKSLMCDMECDHNFQKWEKITSQFTWINPCDSGKRWLCIMLFRNNCDDILPTLFVGLNWYFISKLSIWDFDTKSIPKIHIDWSGPVVLLTEWKKKPKHQKIVC